MASKLLLSSSATLQNAMVLEIQEAAEAGDFSSAADWLSSDCSSLSLNREFRENTSESKWQLEP